MHNILLTCPPMIGMVDEFKKDFEEAQFNVSIPDFTQEMDEAELCEIIGSYDGWIIGDDPATKRVLEAGVAGRLKACMRWGVGTDNVDFKAFEELGVPVENTPGVFGREVADLACHYVTALARQTYQIDAKAKRGEWFKPIGQSLWNAKIVIVGYGDIGKNLAKRLLSHDMRVYFVDPFVSQSQAGKTVQKVTWPHCITHVDYIVFTSPLNNETKHMFNEEVLKYIKNSIGLINVGRGPLIEEGALIKGLEKGLIRAAALDVLEREPINLAVHKALLKFSSQIILGSHNGSNTKEAVEYVSRKCITRLSEVLTSLSE